MGLKLKTNFLMQNMSKIVVFKIFKTEGKVTYTYKFSFREQL